MHRMWNMVLDFYIYWFQGTDVHPSFYQEESRPVIINFTFATVTNVLLCVQTLVIYLKIDQEAGEGARDTSWFTTLTPMWLIFWNSLFYPLFTSDNGLCELDVCAFLFTCQPCIDDWARTHMVVPEESISTDVTSSGTTEANANESATGAAHDGAIGSTNAAIVLSTTGSGASAPAEEQISRTLTRASSSASLSQSAQGSHDTEGEEPPASEPTRSLRFYRNKHNQLYFERPRMTEMQRADWQSR